MKKVISLILAITLLAAMVTVSFNALSVSDEGVITAKEAVEAEGLEPGNPDDTQRIYFQMPNGNRGGVSDKDVSVHHPDVLDEETGEVITPGYDEVVIHEGEKAPSWYSDYNIVDGQAYAGAYWWGGTAATNTWCGYRAEIADYDQGIYYVDVPRDVVIMIWNNGVDGGTDNSQPIYYEAAQTVDTNIEGAYEGDYDSLPYGSPDNDYFDGCIYVIDPSQVSINAFSNKQTCGANWYVYYGDGCYGQEYAPGGDNNDYPDGTPDWTGEIADVCMNPDHYVDGVHVGYHEDTPEPTEAPQPTEAPTEAPQPTEAPTEAPEPTEPPIVLEGDKLYFDTNGTGWTMGSKDKIAFHIFGGDLTNGLQWGAKKAQGAATAGADGVFEIDPAKKLGLTLTPGVQYKIVFVHVEGNNWTDQTYDLLFTTDCLGHIAFCDGTEYENPVDSSKKTLAAFWKDMDASQYGPVLQITSIGNVVGTCPEAGSTPESLFNDFLTVVDETTQKTKYDNAYYYVVEAGVKTEQQMIDDIGMGLGLTKQQVYDAFAAAEIETTWDYTVSTLPGDVVIPTEAPVPTEAPTDAPVPTEAPTDAPVPTEAPTEAPVPTEAPQPPTEAPVTGICGDTDGSGEVDIVDVTFIQRILANYIAGTREMRVRGDVDKDGELAIVDATFIQRFLVGINDSFGIGRPLA